MKLFREPGARRILGVYAVLTALFAIAAQFLYGCGLPVLGMGAVFTAVWMFFSERRCREIRRLSGEIDRILHGENYIALPGNTEGELSVLESEIGKMTVRLREQQHRLMQDKIYLADSIADISHQIRTPLTTINLLVQFLSDPELTEDRRRELCRELRSLLTRIDWLITTLLKISRLDAGTVRFKEETMDFEALLHRACEPLKVPIELRAQELDIRGQGTFRGDVAWTCEAIGNIVKNCMEHTPEGGCIRVTAEENALYAEINIEDTGGGIAKDDLPRIFERFYKGKDADGKGFGIGLSLSRMIVTGQNGIIRASNTPDGARFTIRFFRRTEAQ
jgi:signal transduction histidine kinase